MDLEERLFGEGAAKAVEEAAEEDLDEVVPRLVGLLGGQKRAGAAYALALIAQKIPGSKELKNTIPDLLNLLKDKETSLHGAIALGSILQADPDDEEIAKGIPAHAHLFLAMMLDADDFIHQNGALLLGHVAQRNPDTALQLLSFLIEMLGYDRWRSRWNAIGIIGLILMRYPQNEDIIGALPRFQELLRDESWQVRLNAVGITGAIAGRNPGLDSVKGIVAGLAMSLTDENENVRVMASNWLAAIASKNPENARHAVPALEAALKDGSGKVRDNAEKALGALRG